MSNIWMFIKILFLAFVSAMFPTTILIAGFCITGCYRLGDYGGFYIFGFVFMCFLFYWYSRIKKEAIKEKIQNNNTFVVSGNIGNKIKYFLLCLFYIILPFLLFHLGVVVGLLDAGNGFLGKGQNYIYPVAYVILIHGPLVTLLCYLRIKDKVWTRLEVILKYLLIIIPIIIIALLIIDY